jgi:uncharacterized membrane protein
MGADHFILWISIFFAATVEMVEALTIVLALGTTRGWRSALLATGAALLTLAVTVGIFSRVISQVTDEKYIPIGPLWALVGGLLLIFGLQWMKKAILRLGGVLPSRDETKIYKKLATDARKVKKTAADPIDWYSFTMVFKGVLLEGFEVVFIVVIFGSARGELGLGVSAALAALVFVALLGLLIHRPLSRVPENWMKLTVGVLLVTFGTYFSAEGFGVLWPLGEWALFYLLVVYVAFSLVAIQLVRDAKVNTAKVTARP